MGRIKDIYIAFTEGHDNFDEEENPKRFDFAIDIYLLLAGAKPKHAIPLIADFCHDIFPQPLKGRIWGMASDGVNTFNFDFWNVDKAINGFSVLTEQNIHLYYSPSMYKGWRTDKNVLYTHTIYIDIDDIPGVDFTAMDDDSIKSYLMSTYNLTPDLLPNWLVCSGHGLHLYYLVNELNLKNSVDAYQRALYTDYLITYFGADIACRNKSRILRFPGSKNIKDMDNIKTTRLLHLNQSDNRDISRLNAFVASPEQIEAYMLECNRKREEKRRATMKRNGTTPGRRRTHPPKITDAAKKTTPRIAIPKVDTAPVKPIHVTASHPELKVILSPLPAKSRYRCILRDLHNYAARRRGCPTGYRAIYTHLTAVYLKRTNVSEEAAYEYIKRYVDTGFYPEAEAIIKSVYKRTAKYMYTNKRIAELLGFTPHDLQYSFAAYTDAQKQAARKKTVDAYDEKRYKESRTDAQKRKQQRHDYVKEHPDSTAAQLAETLGCSVRTIKSIRAAIREEEKS